MAEALAAVANGDDALGVAIPTNVIDSARDDVVFSLCVDSLDGVPDADGARDVTGGDVEARGREAGNGGTRSVAGVLFRLGGVVNIAEEDGFARLMVMRVLAFCSPHGFQVEGAYGVSDALSFGVDGELRGLASRGGGDGSQDLVDGDGHCCGSGQRSGNGRMGGWFNCVC